MPRPATIREILRVEVRTHFDLTSRKPRPLCRPAGGSQSCTEAVRPTASSRYQAPPRGTRSGKLIFRFMISSPISGLGNLPFGSRIGPVSERSPSACPHCGSSSIHREDMREELVPYLSQVDTRGQFFVSLRPHESKAWTMVVMRPAASGSSRGGQANRNDIEPGSTSERVTLRVDLLLHTFLTNRNPR